MSEREQPRQRPEAMTPEVFDPYRMPVARLAMGLSRAEQLEGEAKRLAIGGAIGEFHSNILNFKDHKEMILKAVEDGETLAFPLEMGTDEHHKLCSADFVYVASVAQTLYGLGEYEEAMKFARVFGAPAVPLRMQIKDPNDFHASVARELNNWYVGYFMHRAQESSISNAVGAEMFCKMGMVNPTMQVIDYILLGNAAHAGYSAGLDTVQRSHLEEWRRRLEPKIVPTAKAEQLRNDPGAAWDELVQKILGDDN